MRFRKLSRIVPVGILLCGMPSSSQQVRSGPAKGAEGTLTVTATVVASVGLTTGPDGEPKLIYANSADPRDNVSHLDAIAVKLTPVVAQPEKPTKKNPHKHS